MYWRSLQKNERLRLTSDCACIGVRGFCDFVLEHRVGLNKDFLTDRI